MVIASYGIRLRSPFRRFKRPSSAALHYEARIVPAPEGYIALLHELKVYTGMRIGRTAPGGSRAIFASPWIPRHLKELHGAEDCC